MKNKILLFMVSLFVHHSLTASELIPREKLFRQASCQSIKISPDGKKLAYVGANPEGAMNLFAASDLSMNSTQLTHFTEPKISSFRWSPDSKKIILLKDKDGTRQFHLYLANVNTKEVKNLTARHGNVDAKIFDLSHLENKAVIGIKGRNPLFHDLYLLNFEDDSLSLLYENDQFVDFIFNEKLQIAMKMKLNPDSSLTLFDPHDKQLFTISSEDAFHTEFLQYKNHILYLLDNRGSDTTQLKKIEEKKRPYWVTIL